MFEKRLNTTPKNFFLFGFERKGQESIEHERGKNISLWRPQGLFNRLGENVQPQELGWYTKDGIGGGHLPKRVIPRAWQHHAGRT